MRVSAQDKLNCIKTVLKGDSTVTKQARLLCVSRKTIYSWIKRYNLASSRLKSSSLESNYKSGISHPNTKTAVINQQLRRIIVSHPEWGCRKISDYFNKRGINISYFAINYFLKSLHLEKPEYRLNNKRLWEGPGRLSPDIKLSIVKKALSSEGKVTNLAREYNINRKTIYEWIKIYKKALNTNYPGISIYNCKYRIGGNHPRTLHISKEKEIIDLVAAYPELSVHQLALLSNVSNFSVWKILNRHKITDYQSRLIFAKENEDLFLPIFPSKTADIQYRTNWEAFTPNLAPAPPPFHENKNLSSYLFQHFLITFAITIIASFIIIISFTTFLEIQGIVNKIGFVFSFVALFFGMFFFIYSLKYYFAIFIILSRSRTDTGTDHKKLTFVERLFGVQISMEDVSEKANKNEKGIRSGLTFDLSNVILERNPFISIHIASYNEKRVINRLLTAATSLDYPNYEVIIADDSNDETVDLIMQWKNHPRVKISRRVSRDGYKGGALREALKITDPRAEFILIMDADFIPYPDTITQFLKYFQYTTGTLDFGKGQRAKGLHSTLSSTPSDSPIAAVQGYQWHVLNKSENFVTRGVRSEYSGSYVIERSGTELYGGLKQISGSVYMIRRDVLQSIGWGTSITEDFELTLRLYEKGWKVVYTPYIQTPAEAVSTLKRLVRQRMRWAEGHSFNIKHMFKRLLWGRWVTAPHATSHLKTANTNSLTQAFNTVSDQTHILSDSNHERKTNTDTNTDNNRVFIPSPLTLAEKLEFLYLTPYYLQAAFFILGTISWLIAETVFRVRLPFWTEVWGWSLVLTNLFALPLMNLVGLFMEESEEKDYQGLFSFIALSYIVAPFQAYAAIKGFIEDKEGPWFRTPKTGRITDIFVPGRFTRFFSGLFGRPTPSGISSPLSQSVDTNSYLALATANNGFNKFRIRRRTKKWIGNSVLATAVLFSMLVSYMAPMVPVRKTVNAEERKFAQYSQIRNTADKLSKEPKYEKSEGTYVKEFDAGDKKLRYVFHDTPRVRTLFETMAIETELVNVNIDGKNQGKPKAKTTLKNKDSHLYEQIYPDIDMKLISSQNALTEEIILNEYKDISAIKYDLFTNDLATVLKDNQVYFARLKDGGSPVFTFNKPFMFEKNNPAVRYEGIEYKLEKKRTGGYLLIKQLTPQAQAWLSHPDRQFPVIIDPTQVTSLVQTAITRAEGNFGAFQRKIIYADTASGGAAWYVVYNDASRIYYEKCKASTGCDANTDWTNQTQISGGDTDNLNPAVWWEADRDKMWVVWGDNSEDNAEFTDIDVTSNDPGTQGTVCDGQDGGTLNPVNYVSSIAVDSDDEIFISFVDATDTDSFLWRIDSANNCDGDVTAWTDITAGSGVDIDDKPVFLTLGTTAHLFFQDGTTIRHSVTNDDGGTLWDSADVDITGGDADNSSVQFSVTTDGTDIWLLIDDGTDGADLWVCSACSSSPTWTNAADPWSGLGGDLTEVSISYESATNTIAAFALGGSAASEAVITKGSNADSISWGSEYDLGTMGGGLNGLENLATTRISSSDAGIGLVVLDVSGTNLMFSTVPEYTFLLLIILPVLPGLLKRFNKKRIVKKFKHLR